MNQEKENKEGFVNIPLDMTKRERQLLESAALVRGVSLNEFINQAMAEHIAKQNQDRRHLRFSVELAHRRKAQVLTEVAALPQVSDDDRKFLRSQAAIAVRIAQLCDYEFSYIGDLRLNELHEGAKAGRVKIEPKPKKRKKGLTPAQ